MSVSPQWRCKARRAAELAVREVEAELGAPLGGLLTVDSDVPLCRGFGSSTSDVLASIWAVADTFRVRLPRATVARLAVEAETASDSLMFEQSAVLFAHREGGVIEDFGARLPPMRILGFGTGEPVDTVGFLPAHYTARELDRFDELRTQLRVALATQNVALLGEAATSSTWINQGHLPIPHLDRVCAAAAEVGAVGVHTAHSGDIAGFLFDQRERDLPHRLGLAGKLLRDIGYGEQWSFAT
ncbi:kinase [Streptacidiphilus sp. 4-A2]|nr:kinase [Streptacidiphilus sp. 4-A2]